MKSVMAIGRKILVVGGWAPLLVFSLHVLASQGLDAYRMFPPTDIPMHMAGGFAMAFFLSRVFRTLPRDLVRRSRLVVLELVLVGALTTSAAVVWEFAEFSIDQVLGTNIQVSLANTMQDLALGIAGVGVFLAFRARTLGAGRVEIRELATDWMTGQMAGSR